MAVQDGFIGNEQATRRLADRVSGAGVHAYLLTGPAGVGRRTLAERFAAALLCERDDSPCDRGEPCAACALRESGNHPDLLALPRDGAIGIDQIRELRHSLALTPHSGSVKVGIISNAERLGVPAQNALLKLLEEPPAHSVLILTAPSPASLLATTVSRCQVVPLGPVPADELAAGLGERAVADASKVAAQADRRPGRAIRLADDPDIAKQAAAREQLLFDVLKSPVPARLGIAKRLADDADELRETLDSWLVLLRGSLRDEPTGEATRLADDLPLAKRLAGLARTFAARRNLRYNPNTQLLSEDLLLNLGT